MLATDFLPLLKGRFINKHIGTCTFEFQNTYVPALKTGYLMLYSLHYCNILLEEST